MTIDAATTAAVVAELAPIAGGRIQKVDVVAEREIVLEVRCPGRTLKLLIGARPALGRIHLVEARPPRIAPGGSIQGLLRKRLVGRPISDLSADGRTVRLETPDTVVTVQLDGGKDAIGIADGHGLRPPEAPSDLPPRFPASEEVAARYEARAAKDGAGKLRRALLADLSGRRKKREKLLENLERDRQKLERMIVARQQGELLKTALHRVPRGAKEIEVHDWTTGEPVRIALDPSIDAKRNLEKLFGRAKKADRGLPRVRGRIAAVTAELAALDAERARIEAAEDGALPELGERASVEVPEVTGEPAKVKRDPADAVAKRYIVSTGATVLVGKGSAANDRLTFAFARGHDIWLHARGVTGAHVILRMEKGASPHQEALLDAAHLAAHHSAAKGQDRVEIVYTEAKHVKKVKGAPAGQVGIAKERTMLLRVEPARLTRLLDRPNLEQEG